MCAHGRLVVCIVPHMPTISHGINFRQHVSAVQISQVLIIFSHISHHEGVFIQPEGLVEIYFIGLFLCLFCFALFYNGCVETQ